MNHVIYLFQQDATIGKDSNHNGKKKVLLILLYFPTICKIILQKIDQVLKESNNIVLTVVAPFQPLHSLKHMSKYYDRIGLCVTQKSA